ncbi:MAG: MarR family transcriptional regulator [Bacteroidota bacterium]
MKEVDKSLDDIYLFHLDKTYKQYKKFKKDFFKNLDLDLTSDQWIVLKRISEKEGINQKDLADSTFKEPASVTRILDILSRKGYIERRGTLQDRRVFELFLTEAGKAVVDKVIPAALAGRAKGIEGFSAAEVQQLIDLLDRLHHNFSSDTE